MRPTTLQDTLKSLINVRRPVHIEGSPGLGKTQIVQQTAREMGIGFKQIHAPLMQPEDYGMPVVSADRTNVAFVVPTEKFPIEGSDCPDVGVLLVDELPQADNAGQKILANLIQEREIHGKRLKDGWSIVSTGNRTQDRAGANRILSHLRARTTTIEYEAHLDDWCSWALAHGVKPEIVSFIRFKPDLLSKFDPQQDICPTPRAWVEGVSPVVGAVSADAEFECIKGAVGEGAAAEFVGFLQLFRKLPNPDAVLMTPDTYEVPKETNVLYALSGAIAHRATENSFDRVMTFAKRMPPEFMTLVVRDAIKRDKALQNTKAFIDWAITDGARILL